MRYKQIIKEAVEKTQITTFDGGQGETYPYVILPGLEGRGYPELFEAYIYGMRRMLELEIRKSNVFLTLESKGFIFTPALSMETGCDYLLARKRDYKLPGQIVIEQKKAYKESENVVSKMHVVGLNENDKVLILDDITSSGGSACATLDALAENNYQVVGVGFLYERGNGMEVVKNKVRELGLSCPVKGLIRIELNEKGRPVVPRFHEDS